MGEKTGASASVQRVDHILGTGVPYPAQGAKVVVIGNPPQPGSLFSAALAAAPPEIGFGQIYGIRQLGVMPDRYEVVGFNMATKEWLLRGERQNLEVALRASEVATLEFMGMVKTSGPQDVLITYPTTARGPALPVQRVPNVTAYGSIERPQKGWWFRSHDGSTLHLSEEELAKADTLPVILLVPHAKTEVDKLGANSGTRSLNGDPTWNTVVQRGTALMSGRTGELVDVALFPTVDDLRLEKVTADLLDSVVTKDSMKRMLDGMTAQSGVTETYRAAIEAANEAAERRVLGPGYGSAYDGAVRSDNQVPNAVRERLAEVNALLGVAWLYDSERVAWGSIAGRLKTVGVAADDPELADVVNLPTVTTQMNTTALISARRRYESTLTLVEDRIRARRSPTTNIEVAERGHAHGVHDDFGSLMGKDPHVRAIMEAKSRLTPVTVTNLRNPMIASFNGMNFPCLERTIARENAESAFNFYITALLNDTQTLEWFVDKTGTLSLSDVGNFQIRCVGLTTEPFKPGVRKAWLRFVEVSEEMPAKNGSPMAVVPPSLPSPRERTIFERLVANPPAFAYPRAWTCAVLAAQEADWGDVSYFPDELKASCAIYHARRLSGDTHEAALLATYKTTDDRVKRDLMKVALEGYARGMERPAPRLQQQPFRRVR